MTNEICAWLVAEVLARMPELGGRVFPDVAPEGTGNPCLVYQRIDGVGEERLDAGAEGDGVVALQIRIYAGTRKEANGLREAFRRNFQNREPEAFPGWRLEGTGWGDGGDSFDSALREYGATGVIEIFWRGR